METQKQIRRDDKRSRFARYNHESPKVPILGLSFRAAIPGVGGLQARLKIRIIPMNASFLIKNVNFFMLKLYHTIRDKANRAR